MSDTYLSAARTAELEGIWGLVGSFEEMSGPDEVFGAMLRRVQYLCSMRDWAGREFQGDRDWKSIDEWAVRELKIMLAACDEMHLEPYCTIGPVYLKLDKSKREQVTHAEQKSLAQKVEVAMELYQNLPTWNRTNDSWGKVFEKDGRVFVESRDYPLPRIREALIDIIADGWAHLPDEDEAEKCASFLSGISDGQSLDEKAAQAIVKQGMYVSLSRHSRALLAWDPDKFGRRSHATIMAGWVDQLARKPEQLRALASVALKLFGSYQVQTSKAALKKLVEYALQIGVLDSLAHDFKEKHLGFVNEPWQIAELDLESKTIAWELLWPPMHLASTPKAQVMMDTFKRMEREALKWLSSHPELRVQLVIRDEKEVFFDRALIHIPE